MVLQRQDFLNMIYEEIKTQQMEELPRVDGLQITLLENWGCQDFISLNGIELFDGRGERIDVEHEKLTLKVEAQALTKHSSSKRLFNQWPMTNDINKVWIVRKLEGMPRIHIEFRNATELSMIRVWNMNQNRISTNQGVRTLLIQEIFTKKVLFMGEIRKASGRLIDSSKNFETILFTNH